ncbi:MAG: hypothetical protein JNK56_25260 [Myxococcales bacterium]|nr:hypothetical protein [Myxococcales bacterium]
MARSISIDLANPTFPWRLSRALLASHSEAAAVMLDRFHTSPAEGTLSVHGLERHLTMQWSTPTGPQHAAHANTLDATEHGAYAVAFAVVHAAQRYVVVRRAEHGTGADFLLVREGDPEREFIALEVSGIARSTSGFKSRLEAKLQQVHHGLAVVVCFEDAAVALAEAR